MTLDEQNAQLQQDWNYLVQTALPQLPDGVRFEAMARVRSIFELETKSEQATSASLDGLGAALKQAREERNWLVGLLMEVFGICRAAEFFSVLPQSKRFSEFLKERKSRSTPSRLERLDFPSRSKPPSDSWSHN